MVVLASISGELETTGVSSRAIQSRSPCDTPKTDRLSVVLSKDIVTMSNETRQQTSYRPELPDWGAYLTWPITGDDWIHPDDRELANRLLPSPRVFRRHNWDGEYYHLNYGQLQLRVQPSMWVSVPAVDLSVGQQVEVMYRDGLNDPGIFHISDIFYVPMRNEVEFCVHGVSLKSNRRYLRDDLRPLHIQHHLRIGHYLHETPKANIPDDVEMLNVGDLTSG